jgi:hypothetical protein
MSEPLAADRQVPRGVVSDVKPPANDAEPVLVAVLSIREWSIVLAHLQCGRYADVVDVVDLLNAQLRPQALAAQEAAAMLEAKAKAGAVIKPAADAETADDLRVH